MMGLKYLLSFKNTLIAVAVMVAAILYSEDLKFYIKTFLNESELKAGVYSQTKLAQFDGVTYKNLYLAVLGTVFDVTEGKRHYQKGAGYHYFIGKDGSRALVTGNFEDESPERDHVIDLSCNDLFILLHWQNTFKQKYTKVGVLVGRFYDIHGKETAYAKEFKDKVEQCEIEKANAKKEDLKYPPCNVAWSEAEGTKVWCTTSSGGVRRQWSGVPRQLYSPGVEKPRCVCLNLNEKVTNSGLVKEYDNCPNTSTTCAIKS